MGMAELWKKYGIENGQRYVPADGTEGCLIVVDTETYADCDDVVVLDTKSGEHRRIDAFKLAMVRYTLGTG
jgi:hypothetical protein